jgi:hypothetical protein
VGKGGGESDVGGGGGGGGGGGKGGVGPGGSGRGSGSGIGGSGGGATESQVAVVEDTTQPAPRHTSHAMTSSGHAYSVLPEDQKFAHIPEASQPPKIHLLFHIGSAAAWCQNNLIP